MSVITDRNNDFSGQPFQIMRGPLRFHEPSGLALGWRRFSGYFQLSNPLNTSLRDGLKAYIHTQKKFSELPPTDLENNHQLQELRSFLQQG